MRVVKTKSGIENLIKAEVDRVFVDQKPGLILPMSVEVDGAGLCVFPPVDRTHSLQERSERYPVCMIYLSGLEILRRTHDEIMGLIKQRTAEAYGAYKNELATQEGQ